MIDYLTTLDYRWISGREVVLLQPFVLSQDLIKLDLPPYADSSIILIPPGFCMDGASIPRAVWSITGHPFDDYLYEAAIHDWLYATQFCSRDDADKLFLESMIMHKPVNKVTRHIMYRAVRLGGGAIWANKKPESIMYYRGLLDKYLLNGNSPETWE